MTNISTPQQYIDDVLSDRILVCKSVRQAVERHVRDLETGADRGLHFDEAAGARIIEFYGQFKHWKKEWKDTPFTLSPWQQFKKWVLFGWKKEDGTRRFRKAYEQVARKNGKTSEAAIVSIYGMSAEREHGAEIYSAGANFEQSCIVHNEAKHFIKTTPLKNVMAIYKENISMEMFSSKFEPIYPGAVGLDGAAPYFAIVDEYHEHPTSEALDALETGTGSSRQPLVYIITTAGTNLSSPCHDEYDYAKKVLGGLEDDSYFAFIAELDAEMKDGKMVGDDWRDESAWIKANPNLGISPKIDVIRAACFRAQNMPSKLNIFLTKYMDLWVQQVSKWFTMELWDDQPAAPVDENELVQRVLGGWNAYGAIDLAAVSDIASWLILFVDPEDPQNVIVLPRFWCPEDKISDVNNRYRNHYEAWRREGFLCVTEGNAIDYSFILRQVIDDFQKFKIRKAQVDMRFQGLGFFQELVRSLGYGRDKDVTGMNTNMGTMTEPCDEFERRLLKKKINHGRNPVLRWMASNVSLKFSADGKKKMPTKTNENDKIDGIVTLLMAIDAAMREPKAPAFDPAVIFA